MIDNYDLDLRSMQEARRLAMAAREAQRAFFHASQAEVDRIVEAMAQAAYENAAHLGRLAQQETGYGVALHKKIKNEFAARKVWESIKDVKTVGLVREDRANKILEFAWPVGVIAALTPSTNPTSTVIFKVLIAVKARNGIVIAPHPSAKNSSLEALRIMAQAGEAAGMPSGLISCMTNVSLPGTQELMRHWAVDMILATGGSGMVKAAHSVGKPAIGVGPGNAPVWVDRSADVKKAAWDIVNSKAFDNSVICATEQSVIADRPIAAALRAEMEKNGAYWVNEAEKEALARTLFKPNGAIDARTVGKTPQQLAKLAGIDVPPWARILVADLDKVGPEEPLSREKLTTVLGFYVEDGWHAGCERAIQLIKFGGEGHSMVVHARDEEVIRAFGAEKPVFRLSINTWGTLGAIGATTNLTPSMTLAPGGLGGAVLADNISVQHLLNIKRVAYETTPPPPEATTLAPGVQPLPGQTSTPAPGPAPSSLTDVDIEAIVRRVLQELGRG
ncbi:MAG TPA: aldehyde dehydrogenase family protein [Anaerolineae bacterium]|nr:aldehyde dehydrogenase family protein [Anaerolineae bacterium]